MLQLRLFQHQVQRRYGVHREFFWPTRMLLDAAGPRTNSTALFASSAQTSCTSAIGPAAASAPSPSRRYDGTSPRGAARAYGTPTAESSAPDITDAQWDQVVALLNEMAASKLRPSVSGVRRNEFELMPQFMERAGLTPERLASLNFIHVAGTKGKGSTCAMVESVLRRCGYRTGLYTSPHLVDVRERIRVDGRMLPRAEFAASFWRVQGALQAAAAAEGPDQSVGMPSFFYFITLMAMDAFLARPPSLAPHVVVLEVGIGGRLDATNAVVTHGSLAAGAITSLGFDHMELLGDTLPKIAREKAGIMKSGRPTYVAPQPDDAMEALREVATRVCTHLILPPPLEAYRLSGPPGNGPASPPSRAQTHQAAGSSKTSSSQATAPPSSSSSSSPSPGLSLALGGDHMRINAALAVRLAAEWEGQYAAATRAATMTHGSAIGASDASSASLGGVSGGIVSAVIAEAAAEAVERAAGRPVSLLPGGPDAAAAASRALAVESLELPEVYVEGLRTVQWPGRSQVVHDDVAASRGGRVTVYLDGAHTPESMAVCGDWFGREVAAAVAREGAKNGSTRHKTVLLFCCMKERDPVVLLPALGRAASGSAASGARGLPFDAAIFTPILSSKDSLFPAASGSRQLSQHQPVPVGSSSSPPRHPVSSAVQPSQPSPGPSQTPAGMDVTWQVRMRDVWTSTFGRSLLQGSSATSELILPEPDPQIASPEAAVRQTGLAPAQDSDSIGAVHLGAETQSGRLAGLPGAGVARSLPDALEAVRVAASADPRVRVHVLVTGSLYLVGDVLRLLNKPPL